MIPTSFVEVAIKEFKGIQRTKEAIELDKFNVLIGRNNSCKTSLLEALALLPAPWLHMPLIG